MAEKPDREPYMDAQIRKMQAEMDASTFMLALCDDAWIKNVIIWAQVGYMILTDKPIVLIKQKDMKLPEGLVRVALRIEEYDHQEDVSIAIKRLIKWTTEYLESKAP